VFYILLWLLRNAPDVDRIPGTGVSGPTNGHPGGIRPAEALLPMPGARLVGTGAAIEGKRAIVEGPPPRAVAAASTSGSAGEVASARVAPTSRTSA
jgi:hypothetical protein